MTKELGVSTKRTQKAALQEQIDYAHEVARRHGVAARAALASGDELEYQRHEDLRDAALDRAEGAHGKLCRALHPEDYRVLPPHDYDYSAHD